MQAELPVEKVIDTLTEDDLEEEFIVEKIVGKRYNQKKRQFEYLLKWEGYPPEQNTWEPLTNLSTCKSLLQEFERTASSNDKNFNKLTGVLKRDAAPTPVKLQSSNLSKPAGLLPNRHTKDPSTPTLQTQRKIVPVTPLANALTPSKVSTPIITATRSEANKPAEICKPVMNNIDLTNDLNKSTKSPITPLKKRLISNSEDSTPPIVLSPEK